MSWFKRLSIGKLASPKKNSSSTNIPNDNSASHNHSENNNENNSNVKSANLNATGICPLQFEATTSDCVVVEIIDPEEFFDDPHHVRMYNDERDFLDMIAEWVIIENPKDSTVEENFFSADFEAELINIKRSTSSVSMIDEDQFKIYEKNRSMRHSIGNIKNNNNNSSSSSNNKCCDDHDYTYFWGHRIATGDFLNIIDHSDSCSNINSEQDNCLGTSSSIVRKKSNSKTKICKRTIMSAIKDLPTILVSDSSCDHDHDHDNELDIEDLFGLDDNGNIVLDMNHVVEEKGYGFLMCRTRKLYRSIKTGKEIRESYRIRKSVIGFLKEFCKCLRKILHGHPRNKSQTGGPEDSVRAYTLQLANDHSSTFSRNIENFIACTKESREAAPQVVMRNMRQFMSGMKNYLVKHGEGDFQQEVLKARSRLKSDEFLNLDAILEAVMHQLVVLPLREHLYGMFVDYYTRSSDIQLLVENVKYACARSAPEFGIRPSVAPPTSVALTHISVLLLKLQEAELPLEKLDLFLCIISSIFDATGCPRGQQLGADDFLPILVYVVAKCGFVGAEIEAEFMWGLLQPALLSGEAGYYLTALCSAVHVLKSFMASDNDGTGSLDWRSSSLPACSSVLRVIIPDECNGSLQTRTLPVRPHTTTRDVCRIIAHKARITNPQDYGLFKLVDGEETLLVENECPQDARIAARGKHCMLAYKRIDAKIAWPTATSNSFQ